MIPIIIQIITEITNMGMAWISIEMKTKISRLTKIIMENMITTAKNSIEMITIISRLKKIIIEIAMTAKNSIVMITMIITWLEKIEANIDIENNVRINILG